MWTENTNHRLPCAVGLSEDPVCSGPLRFQGTVFLSAFRVLTSLTNHRAQRLMLWVISEGEPVVSPHQQLLSWPVRMYRLLGAEGFSVGVLCKMMSLKHSEVAPDKNYISQQHTHSGSTEAAFMVGVQTEEVTLNANGSKITGDNAV